MSTKTSLRLSSAVQVWIVRRGFTSKTFCPIAPAQGPRIFYSQALVAPCAQTHHCLLPKASASQSSLSSGEEGVTWGLRLPEDLFSSASYFEGPDSIWGARHTRDNNSCWYWVFSIFYISHCVIVNAIVFDVLIISRLFINSSWERTEQRN